MLDIKRFSNWTLLSPLHDNILVLISLRDFHRSTTSAHFGVMAHWPLLQLMYFTLGGMSRILPLKIPSFPVAYKYVEYYNTKLLVKFNLLLQIPVLVVNCWLPYLVSSTEHWGPIQAAYKCVIPNLTQSRHRTEWDEYDYDTDKGSKMPAGPLQPSTSLEPRFQNLCWCNLSPSVTLLCHDTDNLDHIEEIYALTNQP